MKTISNKQYQGERSLFKSRDLKIDHTIFFNGESPLKESQNIDLVECTFEWKYPCWYSQSITLDHCDFKITARSGVWYTTNITFKDCNIESPKIFRRSSYINLFNCKLENAEETLWNCDHIVLNQVKAKGDYFAMNSTDIDINDFTLDGNYCFDGGKNIEIHNAILNSKDSFWNCENVKVYDSTIKGEYIGWNSKNITFIRCHIESDQGFCYMKNVVLQDCVLVNTTLSFEYSTVNAKVLSVIDSVKNPIAGKIEAKDIGELIFDDPEIKKENTMITLGEKIDV